MKKIVDVTAQIELEFDENSAEFQEAFKSFTEAIDRTGTVDDMLKHVTNYILRFGDDRLVEGVGYIAIDGRKQGEPYCGISVDSGYDMFDFEL